MTRTEILSVFTFQIPRHPLPTNYLHRHVTCGRQDSATVTVASKVFKEYITTNHNSLWLTHHCGMNDLEVSLHQHEVLPLCCLFCWTVYCTSYYFVTFLIIISTILVTCCILALSPASHTLSLLAADSSISCMYIPHIPHLHRGVCRHSVDALNC